MDMRREAGAIESSSESAAAREAGRAAPPGDPLDLPGVRFEERYVAVSDDVALRVLVWKPERPTLDWPAVLVPGWVSLPSGWDTLLRRLAARQPFYYVETREKATARFSRPERPDDFTVARCAEDVVAVCEALGPAVSEQVLIGASLGSTILLELMKNGFRPRGAFLISPTGSFRYPFWGQLITYTPDFFFPPTIRFVLWYLRHFRVDADGSPGQMERYEASLRSADPRRLRYSARQFNGYELWPGLEAVGTPVAIAHTANDTLHESGAIARMFEALPTAMDVPAPSDLYLHGEEVAPHLDEFVASL